MRHLLIVSNGYGEDLIGRHLAEALVATGQVTVSAFPLVGDGLVYRQVGIPVVGENRALPSGGFLRSFGHVLRDIIGGLLGQLFRQFRALKAARATADGIIAVGDVFCLIMAVGMSGKSAFFLPTAKSELFMPHSDIEYALIRRLAQLSFPRDEVTHQAFLTHGVASEWRGNLMMDRLVPTPAPPVVPNKIAILPGSRDEAFGNLEKILQVVAAITQLNAVYQFEVALAPQLSLDKLGEYLAPTGWKTSDNQIQKGDLSVGVTRHFNTSICSASAVIGLAGTANEQASFLGKPVFCFEGTGPQSTGQRFVEQSKLMRGGVRFLHPFAPEFIAQEIHAVLRAGGPGLLPANQYAADAVAGAIVKLVCG